MGPIPTPGTKTIKENTSSEDPQHIVATSILRVISMLTSLIVGDIVHLPYLRWFENMRLKFSFRIGFSPTNSEKPFSLAEYDKSHARRMREYLGLLPGASQADVYRQLDVRLIERKRARERHERGY